MSASATPEPVVDVEWDAAGQRLAALSPKLRDKVLAMIWEVVSEAKRAQGHVSAVSSAR